MKDKTIDQMRFELMSAKDRQKNLKRFLKPSKIKERLYHGTIAHDEYADEEGQAFQQFTGRPTWLAGEPYTASGYSKGTGSTYPVYAQIKNPLKIGFDANDDAERAFPLARKLGVDVKYIMEMRNPEKAWEIVNHPSFIDAVVNAGYDGIQINEGGYKTYGVFSPSKIKSATGNRGTYNPSNPDITMAKGGIVHLLRKHGEGVPNELEAMRRMSKGHRVFVVHEQDEQPVEITSVRDLAGYAPDQIYTLAPQHKADGGMMHMADGGSVSMGINVASDRKADRRYADLIVDGEKKFESRNSDTLRPYVGKRVAIVRTGEGPAKAIGEVTIGEPIVVNKKKFRELEDDHMVPEGSAFDITTPSKHLYPLHDPVRYENERDVGHGIVSRKVIHKADGGAINQGGGMPTLAEMRLALMRQNPVNLKNIGVNEATNMDQKVYLPPNRPEGVMHAGGVDMSHEVPGQQLMPLLPGTAPGQPGVPGQPPTGMPQGQMPGAQASPLPAGFNTQAAPNAFPPSAPQPQPPSNILSMLPQGRALNAMQPTKMPAMASGGSAKTYTHEVFNRKTGETKGQYQSIETARKARDRYDNQYGAYVHDVRPTGNVKPRPFENSKQALLRDLKSGTADQYMTGVERFQQRAADRLKEPKFAAGGSAKDKAKKMVESEKKATRVKIDAEGPGGVKGIVVPRHMLEGNPNSGVEGMNEVNKARAKVYGSENRDPLTLNKIGKIHKDTLAEHFQKPVEEQVKAEQEALARLRAAKHIGKTANTLDESEKLDTVRHEHDEEGRTHVGYASKGVAGHALYTSGHGKNEKRHVINTCPGQTTGCGGGVDESGVVDTKKGTCFAPNAESQYPAAAVRRTCHAQAKHDPAMTRDWILAHTGSIRDAANRADKSNKRMLFRPNVVDETDVSSRHVIRHLNEQRKAEGKPGIVANSYGKTNELHDPENGYHVTHSNVGPKVKHGREVSENIGRDKQRVRNTITATSASGDDFKNEQGNHTPPKGSYLVTDVKRGSQLAKNMEKHITHAKYWSTGREQHELTPEEKEEGEEGHFGPNGKPTSPDKSHYGHTTVNGRRYDYQRQHILHPRLVQVGENKDGTPHMIPTDSRFKDTEFLPKKRFQTKNGKDAGHILMTTPTESTSNLGHETSFTHNVTQAHVEHAQKNKGEYEIDKPEDQEKARGKEYAPPQPLKFMASGGYVSRHHGFEQDDYHAFPEQNLAAQRHLAKRLGDDEERKERKPAGKKAVVVHKDLDTMRYEMMTKKGK